ncbi:Lin0368 family putative glycerol transporter subunit [Vallitalea okinawensis]|uniref:Lin0368 family putative glycerol transporter subunit n=1 Tax=Vallitalea okinawensis TaxID=2078660 RepID=UPI000CFD7CC1|nr:hypothetical protein [Vallitalea okinawensis]
MWMISTFAGGFIFAFMIRLLWGKFVEDWGSIGGWMAAGVIVGTAWTLNHGVGLIYQSGGAWIDMAFAAFSGLFLASAIVDGDDMKKGLVNAVMGIIGGILGGFILYSLMFH